MALALVTAPAVEPITAAEARAFLRLDAADGEPAPTAPTAALAAVPIAGDIEDGVHRYRVTFVTADGETEGGTISDAVTVADKTTNGKIELTAIPLGGASVTSRKIYRTAADGSAYLLQSTIADNTTTTLTDNTADASLGAGVPTTNTTEDPILNALIQATRRAAEQFLNRALINQTWDLTLDEGFPWSSGTPIFLPKAPLASVTSVTYTDSAGASQTWAVTTGYLVDQILDEYRPGRVYPAYSVTYPTTRAWFGSVVIRFVAGYGAAASAIPSNITVGMRMLLNYLYEHRDEVVIGSSVSRLPIGVESLWWPFRMMDERVSS
jgi:uncharacterized phiE125 gp8 family phage protein